MKSICALTLALVLTLPALPAGADILNVPGDYQTIADALDAAHNADTVMVEAGEYSGDGFINVDVTRAVFIMSQTGALECLINCNGANNSSAFNISGGATIQGFSITGATHGAIRIENADGFTIDRCQIYGNQMEEDGQHGSGIWISNSSGTLKHCITRNNTSVGSGAGAYISGSELQVFDCIFRANASDRFGGGMQITSNSDCEIVNCGFVINNSVQDGAGVSFSIGSTGFIANCTFMDNRSDGWGGGLYVGSNSDPEVINSIFFGNAAERQGEQIFVQSNQNGDLTISYSAVEDGPQNGDNWDGDEIIEEDPEVFGGREPEWGVDGLFLDPESPCIDAGSGTVEDAGMDTLTTLSTLVLDTGQVDMGYHYDPDNFRLIGLLNGYVTDAATDDALQGALVRTTIGQEALTDWSGYWVIRDARAGTFNITASMQGYNDTTLTEVELDERDTLRLDFALLHPEIQLSTDTLGAEIEPGDSAQFEFSINNNGNGNLDWTLEKELPGEAGVDPWTLRGGFDASEITDNRRVEGVIYVDSLYYVSTGEGDVKWIYILNDNFAKVDSFPQVGNARYGFADLAWDGERLWGSGERNVYAMTLDGDSVTAFRGPNRINQALTWDSQRQLLWMGTIIGDEISAYDETGQYYGSVNQSDILLYGLAFYPEDPDGYQLYVLGKLDLNGTPKVYKIDLENDDTLFVADVEGQGGGPKGAFISNQLDVYSWVFMEVVDNGENDRVDLWQLAGNTKWMRVSPVEEGVLEPFGEQAFTLTLDATGLSPVNLRGFLVFHHNAWDMESSIAVWMDVHLPDAAPDGDSPLPERFTITGMHPNPFNASTTLLYRLDNRADVILKVFDLAGREVALKEVGTEPPGAHSVSFDGGGLPSGVYLFRLEAGTQSRTVKAALVK